MPKPPPFVLKLVIANWLPRGGCAGLLTILALLLSMQFAGAALQFDVFLGYDGVVPEGAWFPVACEIRNDGPTFSGAVEVKLSNFGQGAVRRMPLELPTGTLKRITIPVFCTTRGFTSWDVILSDSRGRVRAEKLGIIPRAHPQGKAVIFGALPRNEKGTPAYPAGSKTQADLRPVVARMQIPTFPDNPLVLEGLNAIYLNSERTADLSQLQAEALEAWVHAGGHLIVSLEQPGDITASPWLERLLPCRVTGMAERTPQRELQQWCNDYSHIEPDPAFQSSAVQTATVEMRDGRVLIKDGEVPLAVEGVRGRGLVTILLISPEREPIRSWRHLPVFWARLTGVPSNYIEQEKQQQQYGWSGWSSDGVFGAMLDSRQVHKLPLHWLLALLGVYLVVIGPFDYFWLKRMRRQMLTWITFPCYVAGFSILIYVIGYTLRAGESELNQIHVVDVFPRNGQAQLRGRSYSAIYAPSNERHTFKGAQPYAAFRAEMQAGYGRGQHDDAYTVEQAGGGYRAKISVPVWTSVLFVADWWQPAAEPFKVTVLSSEEGSTISIENLTDSVLSHLRLVTVEGIANLGDIPAGTTRDYPISKPSLSLKTYLDRWSNLVSTVQSRQYAFGQEGASRIEDLPGGSLVASLLQSRHNNSEFMIAPGLDVTLQLERGSGVLFAWSEAPPPVQPQQDYKPNRGKTYTLWRYTLPSL